MSSGPAIPSNTLMALGSLWCSASEVVCIPQAGVVSDHYSPPPGLCVLGSVMSLLSCQDLQSLLHTVSSSKGVVCMCMCACMCAFVCVCVSSARNPYDSDLLPVFTTDGRHVSEFIWHSEQMRITGPSSPSLLVDHFVPLHCTSESNYRGSD